MNTESLRLFYIGLFCYATLVTFVSCYPFLFNYYFNPLFEEFGLNQRCLFDKSAYRWQDSRRAIHGIANFHIDFRASFNWSPWFGNIWILSQESYNNKHCKISYWTCILLLLVLGRWFHGPHRRGTIWRFGSDYAGREDCRCCDVSFGIFRILCGSWNVRYHPGAPYGR